jgi:2'-hydroxyisoflavone reductase
MNLLVLGGTRFVGRHIVESAVASGHNVTLFNRGQTNPDLFPNLETMVGDREKDLGLLNGRHWDGVIDVCGYVPRIVKLSIEAAKRCSDRYCFISSISVYGDFAKEGLREGDPVATIADPTVEEIDAETYGALKAICEDIVLDAFGDRGLVVRPGLVVGPGDPSDRFTYWPVRLRRGGRVVAPDLKDHPVQFIDGLDLAAFTVGLTERNASGLFNGVGPAERLRFEDALSRMRSAAGSDAEIVWTAPSVLEREGLEPFSDFPLITSYDGSYAGMAAADASKAVAAGLTCRPIEETTRDLLAWWPSLDRDLKTGLKPEKEAALLLS